MICDTCGHDLVRDGKTKALVCVHPHVFKKSTKYVGLTCTEDELNDLMESGEQT